MNRLVRRAEPLALLAGAVTALSFAPFGFFPLAPLMLAALMVLWRGAGPRRAAWLGWWFGLGLFGVGVSWVYVSMHDYGYMAPPLAAFATLLFVAAMALFPALVGAAQAYWRHPSLVWHSLAVIPGFWVLTEWLRAWIFTGFPWLTLGYSQIDSPLAGLAPWLGVYGISLAVALSAGLLAVWSTPVHRRDWRFGAGLVAVWGVAALAGAMGWTTPHGDRLRVTLIQGNVPIAFKWQPSYRSAILERYRTLSEENRDSDLIVWPEGAIPAYYDDIDPAWLDSLKAMAGASRTEILFGVVDREQHGNETRYYNAVASVNDPTARYRKRHLVPFGEYPPMDPLFRWLMRAMHIPMSDFSAGPADQRPILVAGQPVAVSVCYETAFGAELRDYLPQATVLLNVSENGWFGRSFGPHQLLEMTRLRARETGRPVLRADNAGLSAVIDFTGRVQAISPQFRQAVVSASVQPMTGATPYVRLGDLPAVLVALGLLLAAPVRRRVQARP